MIETTVRLFVLREFERQFERMVSCLKGEESLFDMLLSIVEIISKKKVNDEKQVQDVLSKKECLRLVQREFEAIL